MQYLNDENMEELFREAAENYPLKVTDADWNKVQAAFPKGDKPPAGTVANRRKMLWLLTLLLIPLLCNIFNNKNNTVGNNNTAGNNIVHKETGTEAQQDKSKTNTNTISTTNIAASNTLVNITAGISEPSSYFSGRQKTAFIKAINARLRNKKKTDADVAANVLPTANSFSQNTRSDIQIGSAEPSSEDQKNIAGLPGDDKKTADPVKKKPITDFVVEEKKKQNDSSKTAHKEKKNLKRTAGFYVSLLGGPDMSRVKAANVNRIGLSTGLDVGYHINSHISVEAGAFYSEKHYKSDYKYFSNKKTQWPTGATVTDLEGTCKMIELPVTLRYNFNVLNKNKFFAAAGLSSYIMKREDYDYNYSGYGYSGYADKTYKNSSKNWLAVLQISAGWQRMIGKKMAVRVQPYYNVPLKGVGIGSLPISGAGVLAGITIPIK